MAKMPKNARCVEVERASFRSHERCTEPAEYWQIGSDGQTVPRQWFCTQHAIERYRRPDWYSGKFQPADGMPPIEVAWQQHVDAVKAQADKERQDAARDHEAELAAAWKDYERREAYSKDRLAKRLAQVERDLAKVGLSQTDQP